MGNTDYLHLHPVVKMNQIQDNETSFQSFCAWMCDKWSRLDVYIFQQLFLAENVLS